MEVRNTILKGKMSANDIDAIAKELVGIPNIKIVELDTFLPGTIEIVLSENDLEEALNDNHI